MSEIKYPGRRGRVVHGLPENLSLKGTDLVRNHDAVHRRWCWRIRGRMVTAWDWPAGKTRDEVESATENGLRFCRSCQPLDALDKNGGE